jgi:hypothetical protein
MMLFENANGCPSSNPFRRRPRRAARFWSEEFLTALLRAFSAWAC